MNQYFLKASDEAELRQALLDAEIITEEAPTAGYNLDVIGEIPEVIGYHANLIGDLTEDQLIILNPLLIDKPAQPYRVWA